MPEKGEDPQVNSDLLSSYSYLIGHGSNDRCITFSYSYGVVWCGVVWCLLEKVQYMLFIFVSLNSTCEVVILMSEALLCCC